MTEKDIRPIPQSILKEIYKRDLKIDPWQTSIVRYYAYLAIWKKELVKVTVAVSTVQNKHWACKQVAVHGIHTPICLVRDMEYNYFGFGYRVGWHAEELQTQQKPFEDGKWHTADKKYYDPYAELINRSVIAKLPEYKYSAYQHYRGRDIISYLRIYEKYPQTEYLLKLGLGAYAENLSLLKKIAKDKVFCKWFIRHRNELALPWANAYNVTTITQAFKHADGLAPTVTDETTASLLENETCNYIGKFATRNDDFTFFYTGAMFGDYGWIDTYVNTIWLKNVMQVAIMNGLTNNGRVPYNERGYALIRSWLQDPINRALKNGVIDTGVALSESQKAQVMNEAGLDISNELWINGYYIQVEDAGAQVRVTRDSPNVSVWYCYAGSVHRVNVASSALV